MKRFFLLFSILFFFQKSQALEVSDSAQISLFTVEPGTEIYSLFGHSAVRVLDSARGIDQVFNWGTFQFDEPNFLLKFCRGKLPYYIDVESKRSFERGNLADRRGMKEQILNLAPAEKKRLVELLNENLKPENRSYQYDFFFDNCATRIRDLGKETFFHTLQFDSSAFAEKRTLRQLLKPYLRHFPWTEFGIDLVLGQPADRVATAEMAAFLPDHLHDVVSKTKIDADRPLVLAEKMTAGGQIEPKKDWLDALLSPVAVMWFVFGLGILSLWSPAFQVVFDRLFWATIGLAGLIIALLWFATDHGATKSNLNLFWALPTHLLFSLRKSRGRGLSELHNILAAVAAALMVVFWKFLPQELPIAALPLALLVAVKGLFNFRNAQKKSDERFA